MAPPQNLLYVCEICQTVLEEHQCKAVCPNCGRMLDCSDLPILPATAIVQPDGVEPRPGGLGDIVPPPAPDSADDSGATPD